VAAEGLLQLTTSGRLAWRAFGPADGRPVVFLAGMGQGRAASHPDPAATARSGVRLYCIDRPGIGRSTPDGARTVSTLARSIQELMDDRGIERFAVLGWSAGGPYALGIAEALGDRVTGVTVASGVPPTPALVRRDGQDVSARMMLRAAQQWPRALTPPMTLIRYEALVFPALLLRTLYATAPQCDRRALFGTELGAMFAHAYREAARGSVAGLIHDLRLLAGEWSIRAERITAPVRLIYGTEDRLTPPAAAYAFAALVPQATLEFVQDAGHVLLWQRWAELLAELRQTIA
jgi:pimeloyl-ACP methyl ester carboxylesterase